jgi:hypothetical protein
LIVANSDMAIPYATRRNAPHCVGSARFPDGRRNETAPAALEADLANAGPTGATSSGVKSGGQRCLEYLKIAGSGSLANPREMPFLNT